MMPEYQPTEDLKTTRLYRRAIRSGWDVPRAMRRRVIDELAGVVSPPPGSRPISMREKFTLVRAIFEADKSDKNI